MTGFARFWPLLVGAYLAGSISFGLVAVWLLQRRDLRSIGSGNAGATNVLRVAGGRPALLVLLLDIAKGVFPVEIAGTLAAPREVAAAAGLAAVLGHVFPVYFGFRGGKGVATAAGALIALFPLAGVAAIGLFLALVVSTRYVSVGSVVAGILLPLAELVFARLGWTAPPDARTLAITYGIVLVIVVMHRENFLRLVAGTERRLGEPRS